LLWITLPTIRSSFKEENYYSNMVLKRNIKINLRQLQISTHPILCFQTIQK
jgi:hypothetical protein